MIVITLMEYLEKSTENSTRIAGSGVLENCSIEIETSPLDKEGITQEEFDIIVSHLKLLVK